MAWRSTVWTAMGVLRIVPDLRDSGRSAGARGVPRDARGPAWWLALLVCKPLLLLGRRADWRGTERLPGSGGAVLAANHVSQADPLFLGEMILAQGRTPGSWPRRACFKVEQSAGGSGRPATSRSIGPTAGQGSVPRSKPWSVALLSWCIQKDRSQSDRMDV